MKLVIIHSDRNNVLGRNSALMVAKNQIAQLCGDIDKFQFDQVDAVSSGDSVSGQAVIKQRRRSLNRRCDLLRDMALDTGK